MQRIALLLLLSTTLLSTAKSQTDTCVFPFAKHRISSSHLQQQRDFWVSLPLHYADTNTYGVIYVLDAEWRFDLVRNIEFDYSANQKIDKHIIVGIPHIDWEYQRGIDLSFSQSRMEYDGEAVDSTWYNAGNSGGGMKFYQYLTEELMPAVEAMYATNGDNTLIGHSMGGYFGGYLLSMNHPFSTLYLFDPSIWYSDGEVTSRIKKGIPKQDTVQVLVAYQPVPAFHGAKIEDFIAALKKHKNVSLHSQRYDDETHNSLFLPALLKGISLQLK